MAPARSVNYIYQIQVFVVGEWLFLLSAVGRLFSLRCLYRKTPKEHPYPRNRHQIRCYLHIWYSIGLYFGIGRAKIDCEIVAFFTYFVCCLRSRVYAKSKLALSEGFIRCFCQSRVFVRVVLVRQASRPTVQTSSL